MNKIILPVKNIDYVSRSALMRIMRATPALELMWMNRVGAEWFSEKAPHDNYGTIQIMHFKVGPNQKTVQLPTQMMMRCTKIALVCGNRVYSLTLDPSLMLASSADFQCDPSGGFVEWSYPAYGGVFGTGGTLSLRPGLPYNTNYYRYNNGAITFDRLPSDGHLVVEFLGNANATPETMIHNGYVEPMRTYLTWQYHESKSNLRQAKDFERQYYEDMEIANRTVKCPKIDEIMDSIGGF